MRATVVIKSVLVLMLVNGVAAVDAQATTFTYEFTRMSNSCDALSSLVVGGVEWPSGSELLMLRNSLGAPSLVSGISFDGAQASPFRGVVHHSGSTESVNISACDGLMAANANDQVAVDLNSQVTALTGTSDHQKAVPISAVAWLFTSALFGFVMVANRRKV